MPQACHSHANDQRRLRSKPTRFGTAPLLGTASFTRAKLLLASYTPQHKSRLQSQTTP
ncbi:MAG: hypothetical protein QE279_10925 [Rhodoferax sp.]|nr:hypothetical protein [Rhodoferax sp.]